MPLFLAEGQTRTLVSRRAPTIEGPHERLRLGELVVLIPHPSVPGRRPSRFAIPMLADWGLFGQSREHYRTITAAPDRADFKRAADAAVLTLRIWPHLQRHLDLENPSDTVAGSLWQLAGLLVSRQQVRASWTKLARVDRDTAPDDPVRAELASRAVWFRDATAQLDTQVAGRTDHLTRLCDETTHFVRRQRASAEAHAVLREADELIGRTVLPHDPGVGDLAERTAAVIDAYQELMSL
jgi:hypothetical protein